ncbi:DUF4163 domain-containing protein [Selenomonas sp. TAMA-11512]|uniref:DUF3298 and DUF4163 domain-containing protein n=1 Tax=Selenomonas sp. TAMA-11512 TaxID=3095337 RepID=UPI0030D5227C
MRTKHKIIAAFALTTALFLPFYGESEAAAAIVREARYAGENVDLHYPEIETDSLSATEEINEELEKTMQYIRQQVRGERIKQRNDGEAQREVRAMLDYEVTYQDKDYVSVRLNGNVDFGGAHPNPYTYAYIFRLRDGENMDLDDFRKERGKKPASRYTLTAVNQALREQAAAKGIVLYSDFTGIRELPKNIYLDSEAHIHAVFAPYEVGPYSSGAIDIDLDA